MFGMRLLGVIVRWTVSWLVVLLIVTVSVVPVLVRMLA